MAPRRTRHHRGRRLALVGALVGAMGLAACGSGDDAAPAPASAATPSATPTAAKVSASTTEARIAGFAFSPSDLEVQVGDEITWTNDDADAHTVTATSGAGFDSGTLAQGAAFTFKAGKAGSIAYFCVIHPSMKGTITVR